MSENNSARASPSAGYASHSLCRCSITKATASVVSDAWRKSKRFSAHVHRLNDASVRNAVIPEETTLQSILDMKLPEVNFFVEHFIQAYGLTLDESK